VEAALDSQVACGVFSADARAADGLVNNVIRLPTLSPGRRR